MPAKPRAAGRLQPWRILVAVIGLLGSSGCRLDPPLPPDPEAPTPATACDDVPLTLVRVEADSTLEFPSWVEVCTACPLAEGSIQVGDGSGTLLSSETVWSPARECVVGMASDPLPPRPSAPVLVQMTEPGGRQGDYSFDLALASGRGSNPIVFGSSTWHVPLPEDAHRLLGGSGLLPGAPDGVLISLSDADVDGRRAVTLGASRGASPVQDTCLPTQSWATPASLLSRQIATPLVSGDALPGGLFASRGAFQARLTEDADALLDVTLLALLSLSSSEDLLGLSPAEACASLTEELGFDPCVPCGPPSDGVSGLPACVPLLIEVARAERVDDALLLIDADAIPADCRQTPTPGTQQ